MENPETTGSLEELESLILDHFENTMLSFHVTSSTSSFLTIWQKHASESQEKYKMTYLPLFYVIASLDKDTKLSLKLITFHGKVLEELSGFSNLLSNEDKLNFVRKLSRMKLCEGVRMPDNDLKLDASTFSAMYLVERIEQNIIIRSQQCQYGLYNGSVCKMCSTLNTAYSSNKVKYEAHEQDSFYFEEALEEPQEMFETETGQSLYGLPTVLEANHETGEDGLGLETKHIISPTKTVENRNKKPKSNKVLKRGKRKASENLTKDEKKRVLKCKHCPHQTTDIKSLMMHNIEAHTPKFNGTFDDDSGSNLNCEECSFTTSDKVEYIKHMTSFHESEGTLFPCKICEKVFSRKDLLKEHMNTLHKRPYKCPSCPYETAQESRLTRHIQAVHDKIKKYFCEQCSYATSDNYSLKFHIKSVHEKLKPFICEQCTYATTTRQALNNHIKAVHEKLKPFLCELCSTSFSTKYLLVQHVSVIHNKVKEFKCKQCSYETARKYYLLDHIRSVHEKIKQFRCDLCSFETAVKCNLKNHILAVHEKTKPFQCQLCSFEAIRKKQLTQHMASVHDESLQT